MKTAIMFLLVWAVMALTNAAAVPEAEPDHMTGEAAFEEAFPEAEPGEEMTEEALLQEAFPEAELEEEMTEEALLQEDDGLVRSGGCPSGWTRYETRCFRFYVSQLAWAIAERNCRTRGGNLASVHSYAEYNFIKGLISRVTHGQPETWLGASDAQYEGVWLWSDSSHFSFTNFCPGEPTNYRHQHCLQMNFGGGKCWDDLWCWHHRPYVCARRI
ncbi:galactose-specific lectin nattectin-like [Notolabrus celidotus]|uniref:galactose-specific lectin nattectin-like n=1 Tax=Notolabrus celidotus TaxID=1203425 RepID=UPI00148F7650|nr:galactose-specific lectin nattectin-like [Notolabrus celidotus]XP_034531965.1 galactose-specific lectin nattectin-like [Notolabrus celidotus]